MQLILGYKFTNEEYWIQDEFTFLEGENNKFFLYSCEPYLHFISIPVDTNLCFWTSLGENYWERKVTAGTFLSFTKSGFREFYKKGPYQIIRGDFTNYFCQMLAISNYDLEVIDTTAKTLNSGGVRYKEFPGLFLDLEFKFSHHHQFNPIPYFDYVEFGLEYGLNTTNAILIFYYDEIENSNSKYYDGEEDEYFDDNFKPKLIRHKLELGDVVSYFSTSDVKDQVPTIDISYEKIIIECYEPKTNAGPYNLSFYGSDVDLLFYLSSLIFTSRSIEISSIYEERNQVRKDDLLQKKIKESSFSYKAKINFKFFLFIIKSIFILLISLLIIYIIVEIINLILFSAIRR